MEDTLKSPFKFLDPFDKADKDLFFGREEEVERLYDMTFDTRLIVFFGASGTGKTSLIRCGLANKFSETRWQELYIRRGKNINQSILGELATAMAPYQPGAKMTDPIEGLRLLHKYSSKPIFITFDQFEELFILQPQTEEQEQFFRFLQTLLDTPLACKVILVMREEFIAHLWDYERLVPAIFDNRFRIRQLEEARMVRVTENTLAGLEAQGKFSVENPREMARAIIKTLATGKTGLALTYLQVFLDRLYRKASEKGGPVPLIRMEHLQELGTIENLLDDLLMEQIGELERQLDPRLKGVPLKLLGAMVSDERTKKILELDDLEAIRKKYSLSESELELCLDKFVTMRILNRYES
jgi:hypothetical protein